ncbi:MAG: hypothetical protein A2Y03_02095 [Omnitrophica WOR_2 bacterium GWF2_38_59]|nr:MAG: hypothetical protein A2Y03_02095 [Omnitrophica WOR_2 bacterium GWF2_38_59]OGX47771.1 MAG: hypothetical protein A2243_00510 [Omnitrophica WOR_2 bacterium RIFOXYA2_FULL_38_17]OGX51171.1 MAG: hypothetical protein A2267_05415 [Omnitrophica WOR_2 bacterium RIFOXYA12_FULL_38_10]OGX56022.1 MAG: hypothetical protein A2306_00165 [Omnitrophica WOR_2 bacterium RIFOXYB2_FULL_38_16]OGX57700.1 MAG: hypothetical protein A2447_06330 [Omnitrophica WOR_2 bacterium RIFOXYC2_FULL_38_12]HBG60347.1 hypothet
MKVEVKKIDSIKRELRFEVSKERVSKALEGVYLEIGKIAKVKGFRKGKIPRHLLESQYGPTAKEEVVKKLIPEVYQEGVDKEQLHPIDMPDIEDVSFKDGKVAFKATIELKPEVSIKDNDYVGIKVKRKSNKVSDEELNKTLDYFKQGQGKDKELTIDDAFAKGLGYPSLEEFKKSLSRQMEADKDRSNKLDVENQIVDALLKKAKLATPKGLVKKHLEQRVNEMMERLKKQGMSAEDLKKKEESVRKDLSEAVEKDIKVYFILDEIANREKIEISEGGNLPLKVMEYLLKEAKWEEVK